MIAEAVEVKSVRITSNAYDADLQAWYADSPMHVGDFAEYRSFPNLVTFDGRLYGKSCWNSDRMVVVYCTLMANQYAKEV